VTIPDRIAGCCDVTGDGCFLFSPISLNPRLLRTDCPFRFVLQGHCAVAAPTEMVSVPRRGLRDKPRVSFASSSGVRGLRIRGEYLSEAPRVKGRGVHAEQ